MKAPVRVTVTGPAGQIGYATLFRIASGAMFGPDQPVFLTLLERANPTSAAALKGVMMELSDCAFPLLAGMRAVQDPVEAFRDCEVALLIGARPRGPGMERADLLEANAAIFRQQGQALNVAASRNVKVLVVGNPCNTNAWIAMKNAPDLDPKCFSAMLRLDQNRAMSQFAEKTGAPVASIEHMAVWGNHSPAMVPDITFATVEGKAAPSLVDDEWVKNDWFCGSEGRWVTMGVPSDGSYGVPEGMVFGFPCIVKEDGSYEIVKGLELTEDTKARIAKNVAELQGEQQAVAAFIPN